jgi:hypothetical protein
VPKSLLGNPAGKFRCAWKDNIKISLWGIRCSIEIWTELAKDGPNFLELMDTLKKHKDYEHFAIKIIFMNSNILVQINFPENL